MILIIDNYDSFTYNLYQAIAALGVYRNNLKNREYTKETPRFLAKLADTEAAKLKKFSDAGGSKSGGCPTPAETDSSGCFGIKVKVVRNDQISLDEIEKMNPSGIILSPGPGRPENAGICTDIVRRFGPKIPILGVCLGHQAIGVVYGGTISQSENILHGKEDLIFHQRKGLFKGMPLPFKAGRYHSLFIETRSISSDLEIIAETPDGTIMAFAHKKYPIYGVQFHPESILTPEGSILLENFLEICRCTSKTA